MYDDRNLRNTKCDLVRICKINLLLMHCLALKQEINLIRTLIHVPVINTSHIFFYVFFIVFPLICGDYFLLATLRIRTPQTCMDCPQTSK